MFGFSSLEAGYVAQFNRADGKVIANQKSVRTTPSHPAANQFDHARAAIRVRSKRPASGLWNRDGLP
jgi:hypothetical protein